MWPTDLWAADKLNFLFININMIYVLIIIIALCLLWPWIQPRIASWIWRYVDRRKEDILRRMMGMPTRAQEKHARKEAEKAASRKSAANPFFSSRRRRGPRRHPAPSEPASQRLRAVAVDVEYVEIKEFESTRIAEGHREQRVYREEQVQDVEFTEYKERV